MVLHKVPLMVPVMVVGCSDEQKLKLLGFIKTQTPERRQKNRTGIETRPGQQDHRRHSSENSEGITP